MTCFYYIGAKCKNSPTTFKVININSVTIFHKIPLAPGTHRHSVCLMVYIVRLLRGYLSNISPSNPSHLPSFHISQTNWIVSCIRGVSMWS